MNVRIALLVVAGIALVGFLAVAVVLPYQQEAAAREAAAALISGAESAKQQVSASAEKSGNVAGAGRGIKVAPRIDPKHGELKWIVSENGDIRGWNERNALEVTMTPSLKGGKASWNCRGFPVSAMPPHCGGRS
ncbi:MAG TPA: hypothetical protein VM489_08910 [Burkholderiales bacterium]|nr:hypothetical protein [Burkholderiales bacterium]